MMIKPTKQPFGEVLRKARTTARLSATAIAKAIGKTQSYISQIESGAIHPPESPERIEQIAQAIGCDPAPLFIAAGLVPPKLQSDLLRAYSQDPTATAQALSELSATGSTSVSLNVKVRDASVSDANNRDQRSDKHEHRNSE